MGIHHTRKKRAKSPKGAPQAKGRRSLEGYDVRVLLAGCPVCGVGVGDRCVRLSDGGYGAKPLGEELSDPHPDRVQLVKKGQL